VASEVRALAQRSAEAAKEIKALITASTTQVDQGVKLVGETGSALERIVGQVNEINIVVGEIAASAQEEATGLNQVNGAINQMDQVTQQNAAMVEQSTAASHSLLHETNELVGLLGGFSIGQSSSPLASRLAQRAAVEPRGVGPRAVGSVQARSEPAKAAPAKSMAPRRGDRVLAAVGAGRQALAMELAGAAEEGWEEF
jgi:methyl-accepting chemotaxis protein